MSKVIEKRESLRIQRVALIEALQRIDTQRNKLQDALAVINAQCDLLDELVDSTAQAEKI